LRDTEVGLGTAPFFLHPLAMVTPAEFKSAPNSRDHCASRCVVA
jgi:hypothetical protein